MIKVTSEEVIDNHKALDKLVDGADSDLLLVMVMIIGHFFKIPLGCIRILSVDTSDRRSPFTLRGGVQES